MDKPKIETITIEAAVARMIHLDILPPDETPYHLYDYLEIMHDHAEEDYKNARGKIPDEHLRTLELLWIACRERLKFARSLQQALEQAVNFPVCYRIEVVDQAEGRPLLSVKNVSYWANLNFRTDITDWKPVQTSAKKITSWEDCEIRIYKNDKLALFHEGLCHNVLSFQKLGLSRKKDNSINKAGQILFWLSHKKPTSDFIGNNEHGTKHGVIPKDISLLRDTLKKITGLSDDPFLPLNEEKNYLPRFKIIDESLNADKRAKKRARHVDYNEWEKTRSKYAAYEEWRAQSENQDFDEEDDAAGAFIKEQKAIKKKTITGNKNIK